MILFFLVLTGVLGQESFPPTISPTTPPVALTTKDPTPMPTPDETPMPSVTPEADSIAPSPAPTRAPTKTPTRSPVEDDGGSETVDPTPIPTPFPTDWISTPYPTPESTPEDTEADYAFNDDDLFLAQSYNYKNCRECVTKNCGGWKNRTGPIQQLCWRDFRTLEDPAACFNKDPKCSVVGKCRQICKGMPEEPPCNCVKIEGFQDDSSYMLQSQEFSFYTKIGGMGLLQFVADDGVKEGFGEDEFGPGDMWAVMGDLGSGLMQKTDRGSENGPADDLPWAKITLADRQGNFTISEAPGVKSTCFSCPPKACKRGQEYKDVRDGALKCKKLTQCKQWQFELTAPTSRTDRVCKTWTNCMTRRNPIKPRQAEYTKIRGTKYSDAVCADVTKCKRREVEIKAPGAFNDRKCTRKITFPRCNMERIGNTTSCLTENNPKRCNNLYEVKELGGEKFNVPCEWGWQEWMCTENVGCAELPDGFSHEPTIMPTLSPSASPTYSPTESPTRTPTQAPTKRIKCERVFKDLTPETKRPCVIHPHCEWKIGHSGNAKCRSLGEPQFCGDYDNHKDCKNSHTQRKTLIEAPALDAACGDGTYDCDTLKCVWQKPAKVCVPLQTLKCKSLMKEGRITSEEEAATFGCNCRVLKKSGRLTCKGYRTLYE